MRVLIVGDMRLSSPLRPLLKCLSVPQLRSYRRELRLRSPDQGPRGRHCSTLPGVNSIAVRDGESAGL